MACEDVNPTTPVPPEAAADDTVQAPTDDTVPGPPGDIVPAPDSEDHAIVQDPAAGGLSPYVPPPPK